MPDSEESEKESPANPPPDVTTPQVGMFFPAALAPPLIAAGVKAGEKVYDHLSSHEPIAIRVLESVLVDNWHEISFTIKNQTEHGAYLESVQVIEPQGKSIVKREYAKSFGNDDGPSTWLPAYLAPWDEIKFYVKVPKCENRGLDFDWVGKLKLEISRLDQKSPKAEELIFRLRWEAPTKLY